MTIGAAELIERTGLTTRQLDYWCTNKLVVPIGDGNPGSGFYREFEEDIVEPIRFLVNITKVLDHSLRIETLKMIYKAYHDGSIDLGEGITLSWRVEHV